MTVHVAIRRIHGPAGHGSFTVILGLYQDRADAVNRINLDQNFLNTESSRKGIILLSVEVNHYITEYELE